MSVEVNKFYISPLRIFLYPTEHIPENVLVFYPAKALNVEREIRLAENIVREKVFVIEPNTPILVIKKLEKPVESECQDSIFFVLVNEKAGWIWMPPNLSENYCKKMQPEK